MHAATFKGHMVKVTWGDENVKIEMPFTVACDLKDALEMGSILLRDMNEAVTGTEYYLEESDLCMLISTLLREEL